MLTSDLPCVVSECEFATNNCKEFEQHYLTSHPSVVIGSVACGLCEKTVDSFSLLLGHLEQCHVQKSVTTERCTQSWLYPCMLNGCGNRFECLSDLRTHFINSHQATNGEVCVPCCFCMAEFPTWNNIVTNHIASHVCVDVLHCVECQLNFASKQTLMDHVHSSHSGSGLPRGIRIDVCIRNNDRLNRRSDLRHNKDGINGKTTGNTELAIASVSSKLGRSKSVASCINRIADQLAASTKVRVDADNNLSNCATNLNSNGSVSSNNNESHDSERLDSSMTSDDHDLILNASLSSPEMYDATGSGSTSPRAGRRKTRRPMRLAVDEADVEDGRVTAAAVALDRRSSADDANGCVEIVAAVQPMSVQCPRCSYTCNTQFQIKIHSYECHDKARPAVPTSVPWFSCRLCNNVTESLSLHHRHLAHHRSTTPHLVRVFSCVYCDQRSDSMDVIESHVTRDHSSRELKFEVQQVAVDYLQDMMSCPICSGAFAWKEDLLHHIGGVHRLESLITHLEGQFPTDPCPSRCPVPRSLFSNLLPPSFIGNALSGKSIGSATVAGNVRDVQVETKWKEVSRWTREDGVEDDMETELNSSSVKTDVDVKPGQQWKGLKPLGKTKPVKRGLEATLVGSDGQLSASPDRSTEFTGHSSIQRFHCELCDFGTNDLTQLNEHSSTCHLRSAGDKRKTAEQCSSETILQAQSSRRYRCDLCPFTTAKSHCYRRHKALHARASNMTDGFRCMYCQFAHVRRRCVHSHIKHYHPDRPIQFLRISGGVEASESEIPASGVNRQQSGTRPESVCSDLSAVKESESLTAALEQQLPPTMVYSVPVSCPLCDFTNRVRVNLVRHIRLHHGGSGSASRHDDVSTTVDGQLSRAIAKCFSKKTPEDTALASTSLPTPLALGSISPTSSGAKTNPLGVFIPSVDASLIDEDTPSLNMPFNISDVASPFAASTIPLPTKGKLSSFVETITEVSRYRCRICGFQSSILKQVKLHLLRIHCASELYECACCSRSINGWAAILKHASTAHVGCKSIVIHEICEKRADFLDENVEKLSGFGQGQNGLKRNAKNSVERISKEAVGPRQPKTSSPIVSAGKGSEVQKVHRTVLNVPSFSTSQKLNSRTSVSSPSFPLETRSTADEGVHSVKKESLSSTEDVTWNESDTGNIGNVKNLGGTGASTSPLYSCLHCPYISNTTATVRQHVMAHHLNYRPYTCPYCDPAKAPRTVKSSPITKHVRIQHPMHTFDQRPFLYQRDEEKEEQIAKGYRLIPHGNAHLPSDEVECQAPKKAAHKKKTSAKPVNSMTPNIATTDSCGSAAGNTVTESPSKLLSQCYRCCYCGLMSRGRADMRYHLMREIGYKPFSCGHCESSSGHFEPTKPFLMKHFRRRHAGMTEAVIERRDAALDAKVDRLIAECGCDLEVGANSALPRPTKFVPLAKTGLVKKICDSFADKASNLTTNLAVKIVNTNGLKIKLHQKLKTKKKIGKKKSGLVGSFGISQTRRCLHCGFQSSSKTRLNDHIRAKHGAPQLRCVHCNFTGYYPSHILRHCRRLHRDMELAYFKVNENGKILSKVGANGEVVDSKQIATEDVAVDEVSAAETSNDEVLLPAEISNSDSSEAAQSNDSGSSNVRPVALAARRQRNTARKSTASRLAHNTIDVSFNSSFTDHTSASANSSFISSASNALYDSEMVDGVSAGSDKSDAESDADVVSPLNLQPVVKLVDICWGLNICKLLKSDPDINSSVSDDNT